MNFFPKLRGIHNYNVSATVLDRQKRLLIPQQPSMLVALVMSLQHEKYHSRALVLVEIQTWKSKWNLELYLHSLLK